MQKRMIVLMWMLALTSQLYAQPFKKYDAPGGIDIHFYRNVEFLGFVFFTGSMAEQYENNETFIKPGVTRKEWFAYDLSLYQEYKVFKDNPLLAICTRFAEEQDGSVLFRLLLQVGEFPRAQLRAELPLSFYKSFSTRGDSLEARQNAAMFIQSMNSFYEDVRFDEYFKEKDSLYEKALAEVRSKLPAATFIPAMERFYRQQGDEYILVPSLTIPSGMAFGPQLTIKGKQYVFNIFGPYNVQQFKPGLPLDMGFADEEHIRELSTHEFGHSFVNPVVLSLPAEFFKTTAPLFEPIRDAMDNQAYQNWKTCVVEHFVRAGEILIARQLGDGAGADKLLTYYTEGRRFIYLPVVIAELEKYARDPNLSYRQAAMNVMEGLKTKL